MVGWNGYLIGLVSCSFNAFEKHIFFYDFVCFVCTINNNTIDFNSNTTKVCALAGKAYVKCEKERPQFGLG